MICEKSYPKKIASPVVRTQEENGAVGSANCMKSSPDGEKVNLKASLCQLLSRESSHTLFLEDK
jgi:hypothetical protein